MNHLHSIERLGARAAYDGHPDLEDLSLQPELKKAFEDKDQSAVERLLGADAPMMMILVPADDDAPADDEPGPDEPGPDDLIRRGLSIRQAG